MEMCNHDSVRFAASLQLSHPTCRKGDYFRYLGELKPESEEIRDSILAEYKQAVELTRDRNGLPPSHPIALGLLLNVTIFYYDVLREKRKAIFLTERGYDEAYRWHLDSIPHERYRDSVVLLQMLKDNLTMWKGDPEFLREQAEQKAIDGMLANKEEEEGGGGGGGGGGQHDCGRGLGGRWTRTRRH